MAFAKLWVVSAVFLAGVQALRTSYTIAQLRELSARDAELESQDLGRRDVDPSELYPAYNLSVPIDHLHNDSLYEPHTDDTFNLRYWFDATYYKEGGPVIVLQSGESSGRNRLPFLQKGIVAQLAEATGGIGVILEHRYYGASFPFPDLSTENLRFLTTDQALADQVYFAKNVVFNGLEHLNLTAATTPYIAYGGSYAGAFVAILRKAYPDVYWGSISSSGVTEAIYDYWQYYEAQRIFGPRDCITATQKLTNVVDNILIGKNGTEYVERLKTAFGLGNVTSSADFANEIAQGIAGLQGTNWDPALNDTTYGEYCGNVSSTAILYPQTESLASEAADLIAAGGWANESDTLVPQLLNYIGYVNVTAVVDCAERELTQDQCFTNLNTTYYQQDDISQTWRSWAYQYCTEWGFLQTGSGVPADILPLISRTIDIPYTSAICVDAFNITTPSDTERINKWGGFGISYRRLAIIDGEKDPWRAATPHALGQPDRHSTTCEPFILIKDGVHHWDENGLFPNETTPDLPPPPVANTQKLEVKFVKKWVSEWKLDRGDAVDDDDGPTEL